MTFRYYETDEDIQEDWELQGFVNEVSSDGNATNGAKYKGFPNKFTTREDLVKFITRFIWINVQHAANNYPLVPYGAYVPIAPTRLYDSPSGTDFFHSLPNGSVSLMQSFLEFAFAGIRLNRLFDYSKEMADERARKLVQETYDRLTKNVQEVLEKRNRGRFERGDLTYQYLEPKWLVNSIHA